MSNDRRMPSPICGVRCRLGRMFGITFTLALVTFCYVTFIARYTVPACQDSERAGAVLSTAVLSCCFALMVVSFGRIVVTHPGRVPAYFEVSEMNLHVEELFYHRCHQLKLGDEAIQELRHTLRVGSSALTLVSSLRQCDTCEVYKCNSTHHCSSCGTCVFELDHHCPWVGGCIGHANHKYFLLFLFWTVISAVVLVATCAQHVFADGGIRDKYLFAAWIVSIAFTIILAPFLISATHMVHENTSTIAKMQQRRRGVSGAQRRPQPPSSYTSVHVDGGEENEVQQAPQGLARIMGVGPRFPWWLLPVAPTLVVNTDRWDRELAQEIEDQIEHLMSTTIRLQEVARQAATHGAAML